MRAAPPWDQGARPSPYGVPGRRLCRARPGRMEEMTVPLDMMNDIRSMDADGAPCAEIARKLHVGRDAVAECPDMEGMPTVPPLSADRVRPALEGHREWIARSSRPTSARRVSSACPPGTTSRPGPRRARAGATRAACQSRAASPRGPPRAGTSRLWARRPRCPGRLKQRSPRSSRSF